MVVGEFLIPTTGNAVAKAAAAVFGSMTTTSRAIRAAPRRRNVGPQAEQGAWPAPLQRPARGARRAEHPGIMAPVSYITARRQSESFRLHRCDS